VKNDDDGDPNSEFSDFNTSSPITLLRNTKIFLKPNGGRQISIFRICRFLGIQNAANSLFLISCAHGLLCKDVKERSQSLFILINKNTKKVATNEHDITLNRSDWQKMEIGSLYYARLDNVVDYAVYKLDSNKVSMNSVQGKLNMN